MAHLLEVSPASGAWLGADKELVPLIPQYFTVGGKLMSFVKVDDYAFRFEFDAPNPSFPLVNMAHVFGFSHDNALPAHYLKQFHLTHNPQANDQAKRGRNHQEGKQGCNSTERIKHRRRDIGGHAVDFQRQRVVGA